jgi:hypothetical protein
VATAGTYAHADITDYRGRAIFKVANSAQGTGTMWPTGSLALKMQFDVISRIGLTSYYRSAYSLPGATTSQNLLASITPGADVFERNASFWMDNAASAANYPDLSSMGVWASPTEAYAELGKRTPVLISSQHALGCYHAKLFVGDVIKFAPVNNTSLVSATITSVTQIGTTDLVLYYFATPVSSAIKIAHVLPSNWRTYLPSPWFTVIRRNWKNQFCIMEAKVGEVGAQIADEFNPTDVSDANTGSTMLLRPPMLVPYLAPWSIPLVNYDSNGAIFSMFAGNANPVLLGLTRGIYDSGCGYANAFYGMNAAINAAMTTAGGSQQLTEVSLAGYTAY